VLDRPNLALQFSDLDLVALLKKLCVKASSWTLTSGPRTIRTHVIPKEGWTTVSELSEYLKWVQS